MTEMQRFDMTWYHVSLGVILLATCAPFILILMGRLADELQATGRLGALLVPAVPLGLLALLVWLVVLIVNGVRWSRRQDGR